jgi:Helicase conserved C-terminal domain
LMQVDSGVGLLTAHDSRIASGRLPRDALLARFAPRSRGAAAPAERERVTLLIATDLLSEGVNLQDASVVVHLDVPWNPARLAQRVGRVRRPGGAAVVHAYLLAPPARAEQLLDVEQRLRRKLAEAARTIGRGIDVVPRLGSLPAPCAADDGRAAVLGAAAEQLARWARVDGVVERRRSSRAIAAAVESASVGWLAALDDGRLVASLDGAPPDAGESVARAVKACGRASRPLADAERREAVAECQRWLDAEELARDCGQEGGPAPELVAAAERRIARALLRAPRHERVAMASKAKWLRDALRVPMTLGAERALRTVLDRDDRSGDAGWLAEAIELLAPRVGDLRGRAISRHIVSLVVFGPACACE